MTIDEKFPNIDWYCNKCLSSMYPEKAGFYRCPDCGHINWIGRFALRWNADNKLVNICEYIVETARSYCLYLIITNLIFIPIYLILCGITLIIERFCGIYDGRKLWILRSLFSYLFGDIIHPFFRIIVSLTQLFTFWNYTWWRILLNVLNIIVQRGIFSVVYMLIFNVQF